MHVTLPQNADDAADLAPLVLLSYWLPAALGDLLATLLNMFRDPAKDAPVYRDQLLEAWGLHTEAVRCRRDLEAAKTAAARETALALARDKNIGES